MMRTERRSAPRQGVNSLLYLDLEPDNGGILLNLSENGMQITVARRLVTSTELRFTLCLTPNEKICGTGRIAWLSPSGRSAGVHFLDLPEEARREIRQWMCQTADDLSARNGQELDDVGKYTSTMESAAVAPLQTQALAVLEVRTPNAGNTLLSPVEAPAPPVEAPPAVVEQAQEIMESGAPATEPAATAPPAEAESSQPSEPMLASATAEDSTIEVSETESPAPLPTDPLELLVSTVDEQPTLEPASPAWTPPSIPPIEAPLADGGSQPSLLSLYGMDGREKEEKPLPAPPPQTSKDTIEETKTAAVLARIRRREARRQARAAARAPLPLRPRIEPDPVILDGLTDVSAPPRPSAPAGEEATIRALSVQLTNPIFIPVAPQFPLPPELPAAATQAAAAAPPIEISPAAGPLPDLPPGQLATVPAIADLPVAHIADTSLAHGALYLPNYKARGITPSGTWRASRLFLSPVTAIPELMERFEAFGWSLESDWHIWLALILLLAGFLSLVQNPPLVVLTVAFWFASAVVALERKERKHSRNGPMRPQRPGSH